jgi:hypothetical protein
VKIGTHLAYRFSQFQQALLPPTHSVDTDLIQPYLTPPQLSLFRQLQPSEQWHSLAVLQELITAGKSNPALLTAACLHDIGKILYPLKVWERVLIVVGNRLAPGLVQHYGRKRPRGCSKPFVVACQHATWGADLAGQAGASQLTVDLIRRHEDRNLEDCSSPQAGLLCLLQQADNRN